MRGEASDPEGSQPLHVLDIRGDGGEAGFPGEAGSVGRGKRVGDPSQNLVPEGFHFAEGGGRGGEEVGSISQDGEEHCLSEPTVVVGPQTLARLGEATDEGEGAACGGYPFDKVGASSEVVTQPVTEPSDHRSRVEQMPSKANWYIWGRGAVSLGSPVDQFGFEDGEDHLNAGGLALDMSSIMLKALAVSPVGGGSDRNREVVDVREYEALGERKVKGGNIYNKQQGRDGGALRDSHLDFFEGAGAAFEEQAAGAVGEEGRDPAHYILRRAGPS